MKNLTRNEPQQNILRVNNSILFPALLGQICWWMLVLFLVFLPFQNFLSKILTLPPQFSWVDEVFIVIMLFLAIFVLIYRMRIKTQSAYILMCLLSLVIIGAISGVMNGNPLAVTFNGVFDYVKNFLVIPIFAWFLISKKRVIVLYELLHKIVLILCLIAMLQEIAFFLHFPVEKLGVLYPDLVRFGLLRVDSLMSHPNIFGLYVLMFFTLEIHLHRRIRWQNVPLLLGIFLSLSRMVWLATVAMIIFSFAQNRSKRFLLISLLLITFMSAAVPFFYYHTIRELGSETSYRGYVLLKSLEIWKDHSVLGVGPGMYGGVVSVMFNSPIYKEYNFSDHWFEYGLKRFHSLDQFWPQLMAEMGIVGLSAFLLFLFLLWKIPRKVLLKKTDFFKRNLLQGLSVMPIILFVYLFGSGLNLTPFLLTYSCFLGAALGMRG